MSIRCRCTRQFLKLCHILVKACLKFGRLQAPNDSRMCRSSYTVNVQSGAFCFILVKSWIHIVVIVDQCATVS
eukprot:7923215-Pyramimonas_sp.AAC.1